MNNQLLTIIANLIVSAISGFLGFKFSRKIESFKNKHELLETSLSQVFEPLMKVLPQYSETSVPLIIKSLQEANTIMKNNDLFIPDAHKRKIEYLISLIKNYNSADDYLKKDYEHRIIKKYKKFYSLIRIYYNEIKRDLGYPYYTNFQYMKYSSNSPHFDLIYTAFFLAFVLTIYLALLITEQVVAAVSFMAICCTLLVLSSYIYRVVDEKGGLKVALHIMIVKINRKPITVGMIIFLILLFI
jgi:hypothetical protein